MGYWIPLLLVDLLLLALGFRENSWPLLFIMLPVSLLWIRVRSAFRAGSAVWLFRPDVAVLFGFTAYFVPVLLDFELGRNLRALGRTTLVEYLLLSALFLISFFVATGRLDCVPSQPLSKIASQRHNDIYHLLGWTAIAIGLLLYGYFVFSQFAGLSGLFEASRLEYYQTQAGRGFFTSGLNYLRFGWFLVFGVHVFGARVRHSLPWHLLAVTGFSFFFLLNGERSIWVRLLVGLVFIFMCRFPVRPRTVVVMAIVGFFALHVFSTVRFIVDLPDPTLGDLTNRASLGWLNPAGGEVSAHFAVADRVLPDPKLARLRWGRSYLSAFLNLIPLVVWPGRDNYLDLPQIEFIEVVFPRRAEQGFGMGYSFVLESFVNFGYLGPLLVGLVLGWILSVFYSRMILRPARELLSLCLYASILPALLMLPRTSSAGFLKNVAISSLLPYLMVRLVTVVLDLGKARHSGEEARLEGLN